MPTSSLDFESKITEMSFRIWQGCGTDVFGPVSVFARWVCEANAPQVLQRLGASSCLSAEVQSVMMHRSRQRRWRLQARKPHFTRVTVIRVFKKKLPKHTKKEKAGQWNQTACHCVYWQSSIPWHGSWCARDTVGCRARTDGGVSAVDSSDVLVSLLAEVGFNELFSS